VLTAEACREVGAVAKARGEATAASSGASAGASAATTTPITPISGPGSVCVYRVVCRRGAAVVGSPCERGEGGRGGGEGGLCLPHGTHILATRPESGSR
jgi:hypothetical protein